jgi:hypothetical protein
VTKIISLATVNLVTPKVGTKHELLFNKPASEVVAEHELLFNKPVSALWRNSGSSIKKIFYSTFTEGEPYHHLTDGPTRGRIFSCVRPLYERAVRDIDRSMHISLWVLVAHSSFIEGSQTTKNTASVVLSECLRAFRKL